MEDAHLHLPDFTENWGLFGVFDGHGGQAVAILAREMLPGLILNDPAFKEGEYKTGIQQPTKDYMHNMNMRMCIL